MTYLFIADPKYCSNREQQLLASFAAHLQKKHDVIMSPAFDNYFDNIKNEDISEALRMASIPSVITITPLGFPTKLTDRIENHLSWSSDIRSQADLIQVQNVLCHLEKFTEKFPPIDTNQRSICITTDTDLGLKKENAVKVDENTPLKDLDLLLRNSLEIIISESCSKLAARALVQGCAIKGNFHKDLQMFETSLPEADMPEKYEKAFIELNQLEKKLNDFSKKWENKKKTIPKVKINNWIEEEITSLDIFLDYEKQKNNIMLVSKIDNNLLLKLCFFIFYYFATFFYFLLG